MITVQITEQTPSNMLRAIRAACNELLGETTADLTTQAAQHKSRAEELCVAADTMGAQTVAESLLDELAASGAATAAVLSGLASTALAPIPAIPETDSTGAEWDPELHASTKTKNSDGTWKKRRGAAQVAVGDGSGQTLPPVSSEEREAPALPPIPPAPPAPAGEVVTMNEIWTLITNGKSTLDKVLTAAQAMGFADLGAVAQTATAEQRAVLLAELTKEVA